MADRMRIELTRPTDLPPAQQAVERSLAWAEPMLPGPRAATVPRWSAAPTWTPPGTILLVRHRALDGSGWLLSNDRHPPAGYEIEFDLGLVHVHAQPGTQRLVASRERIFTTPFEGLLDDDHTGLGFVEQAPLPMLEALELRRDPASGRTVLVSGVADPLYHRTEPLGVVGFIESYPINPREVADIRVERRLRTLSRTVDEVAWRHEYSVDEQRPAGAAALGGVWSRARLTTVPLLRRADGTLTSPLLTRQLSSRPRPVAAAKWIGAPLRWAGRRPRMWAFRASASRARQLTRLPALRTRRDETVLCHIEATPRRGYSPLFSARHPVLPDQYLTRSELEASDLGYRVEGIIGWVLDRRADGFPGAQPPEVKWASGFGKRRRYVEGPRPG